MARVTLRTNCRKKCKGSKKFKTCVRKCAATKRKLKKRSTKRR